MLNGPVLIVDDDRDLREILADGLVEHGFEVLTATNGAEGLQLARAARRPAVIVLDLMMPVMDGYGFLDEREKDPVVAAIPVAIVSAGSNVDRARVEGRGRVIPKPFDMAQLAAALEELGAGK